ncbi:MAG: D-glycerate dehydrogenase [Candidatus Hydrogenedentes bacterium]|nr:D-glycerate dehydrogenase [Candidatus Hydrogenedentota bacterium]
MPKIFVTRPIPQPALQLLLDAFSAEDVKVYPIDQPIPREELLREVQGVDAIFSLLTEKIDGELLDAAGPQLQIVANMAVGYDNVDVPAATERRVPVTNTPDVLTETTADLAWTLLLGASRRAGEGERFLRNGQWKTWSPTLLCGYDVYGKTLGIFGMGRIGQAVARRAKGFGMQVIYHNPDRLPDAAEQELNARHVSREELLRESDILSVHCPLTPETRHAFGASEFQAMKKTAVFVNTSRGPVVDEAALAAALKAGEIFAAGIDVFEKEPQVHPDLLACENAFLLPHLGSATLETRTAMATIAAKNIVARLQGNPLLTCINPDAL